MQHLGKTVPVVRTGRQTSQVDQRAEIEQLHHDPQHDPNQGACNG